MSDVVGIPRFVGDLPPGLIHDAVEGKCILFVGAGLSAKVRRSSGAPLPTWAQLLAELNKDLVQPSYSFESSQIDEQINRGRYLEAAQAVSLLVPKGPLQQHFEKTFGDPSVAPSPTHRRIPTIRLRAVLTSNYDSLIEDAYAAVEGSHPLTFTYADYLSLQCPIRNPRFFVYKIHGDYKRIDTIILSTRNYQDLIHYNPGYRFLLGRLFADYTIVFVGYGGTDPDLDDIIDNVAVMSERSFDPHYLLVPSGRFNALDRRILLDTKRLHIIEYDPANDHQQVEAFIAELCYPGVLNYRSSDTTRSRVLLVGPRAGHTQCVPILDELRTHNASCSWSNIEEAWSKGWLDRLRTDIELCDLVVQVVGKPYVPALDMLPILANMANRSLVCLLLDGASPVASSGEVLSFSVPDQDDRDAIRQISELLLVASARP
jgi:hypothetical protein